MRSKMIGKPLGRRTPSATHWLAAAAALLLVHAASAQEINYGALSAMFGEPVTSSATGLPQTVSQVPANMQIISQDEIARSGATNIPDILRYVAGIDVRSYGRIDNEVMIRGYSQTYNPRLLVLINGRQVYLDDYGYTAWATLPVQLPEIRQIEIVRGPASALFGFNAVSGVINIITFDPLFDRVDNVQLFAGTNGTYQGSAIVTAQKPGTGGVRVSVGGLKATEYSVDDLRNVTPPIDTKPLIGSYAVDSRYKPSPNTELTLDVTQAQANGMFDTTTYVYVQTAYRSSSVKASAAADTDYGVLTLLAYMNQVKVAYQPGTDPEPSQNQVAVVQLSDLFKPAKLHAIRLGLEYRNNREFGPSYNNAISYQDYAASLMWNWQIAPELSFTAAGRLDHLVVRRTDPVAPDSLYPLQDFQHAILTEPTFNLGLVYQPTGRDTLRALLGRAVQAPSLFDYGLVYQTSGIVNVVYGGNPYLKGSTATNYELDYDRTLPRLNATLRTAFYYNVVQDLLAPATATEPVYDPATNTQSAYAANIGHGQSWGGELGLQGLAPSGLRWKLAYSLIVVRAKLDGGPPAAPLGFDDATPTSAIDFGLGYDWRRLEMNLAGKWQSRYQDFQLSSSPVGLVFNAVDVPNYVTLTARIGYRVTPHLTLAICGNQLPAARTVESGGLEPQRSVLFSATATF